MKNLLLLVVLIAPAAAVGQVYKCVTPDGKVSFANVPCKDPGGVSEAVSTQTNRLGVFATPEQIQGRTNAAKRRESPEAIAVVPGASRESQAQPSNPTSRYAPMIINEREVPYRPDQSPLDRRLQQIKNKMENPLPQDVSQDACVDGKPKRGVVRVGKKEIWPGMRSIEVRRAIGSPLSVNSPVVGMEQWVYRFSDGGSLYVYMKGLCVSSIE